MYQNISKIKYKAAVIIIILCIIYNVVSIFIHIKTVDAMADHSFSWIDFNVTQSAMNRALELDIESHDTQNPLNWIDLLAYLGAKYGGNFKQYRARDFNELVRKCKEGTTVKQLAQEQNLKYFDYYRKAYDAVLNGMVGESLLQVKNDDAQFKTQYGLKAYSPVAEGFSFSHYDDFGNSRSFGYRRPHQGHDLFGRIGTPIVAVESGVVETLGWNQYGGWRIGIRSLDGLRFYYYAHLRKNKPYQSSLEEGALVQAGDVIGYLGMTGYSSKENVNGMNHPHLHFGIEIIPDGFARESDREIWIDTYEIIKFLEQHKSTVVLDDATKEYHRKYDFLDLDMLKKPDH